jgi:hypothetical protein
MLRTYSRLVTEMSLQRSNWNLLSKMPPPTPYCSEGEAEPLVEDAAPVDDSVLLDPLLAVWDTTTEDELCAALCDELPEEIAVGELVAVLWIWLDETAAEDACVLVWDATAEEEVCDELVVDTCDEAAAEELPVVLSVWLDDVP